MIRRSTNTLKKKTGIVILVGIAARFTISVIPIPPIMNGQKTKYVPVPMNVNSTYDVSS